MNLTDDELRTALHSRANRIAPPADAFTGVEARARRIHRRRVAAAVAGTTAAVIAVAVVVPTVLVGGSNHPAPVTGPPTSPAPSTSAPNQPTPTQTPTEEPTPPTQPDAVQLPAWDYRGDKAILGSALDGFQADWSAKHPGSTIQPLFGEIYEPSQMPELVFVASGGPDGPRWGFAMKTHDRGTNFYIDEPLAADTKVLAVAAPGDEGVARLLAVAAPTVKAIQYAPDGSTFKDMYALAPGVGISPMEGDIAKDQIRVIGTDGSVIYTAPAPDPAGAAPAG